MKNACEKKREQDRLRAAKYRASLSHEELKNLYASNSARRSAKRAAKAIADGRDPGKCGPRKFSDEELQASRKKVHKRFREKHLESRREYERKWKENLRSTPEGRKYLQELAVVHGAKRRAQKAGCSGSHTAADIRALYFEQKGLCGLCDLPMDEKNFHVDHWKPLSKGGSNDKGNLKLLHPKCNLMKHDKLPTELSLRSA